MNKDKIIRNRIVSIIVSVSVILSMLPASALAEDVFGGAEDTEVTTTQTEETPEVDLEETGPTEEADGKSEEPSNLEEQPENKPKTEEKTEKEPRKNRRVKATPTPESEFTFDALTGTITSYDGVRASVVIPETIGGVPVTKIRGANPGEATNSGAFGSKYLNSVVIPDSVTYIGPHAFSGNFGLASVTLGNSVELIAYGAFENAPLTNITLPDSLVTIESRAFAKSKVTDLVIPNSVVNIGNVGAYDSEDNVFMQVSGVLTIGSSVKTIGHHAFKGPITELNLPESLETIGDNAFYGNKLTSLTIPSSVKTLGKQAFMVAGKTYGSLATLVLNNGLESIGVECFKYQHLTELSLPDSVLTVGKSAFYDNDISTLKLSAGMDTIGDSVFQLNHLAEYDIPSGIKTIGPYAFCNNLLTRISIPNTVTKIDGSAFQENKLTEVTIPESVKTISYYAFQNNQIKKVNFSEGLEEILDGAFEKNQLTDMDFPVSLKTIGEGAFLDNQIKKVNFKEGLEKVLAGAFENNRLTDMQFPASITTIGKGVMKGQTSVGYYTKAGSNWELNFDDLSSTIYIPGVTTLANIKFDGSLASHNSTTHVVTLNSDPTGKTVTYQYLLTHPSNFTINGGYGDVTLTLEPKPEDLTVTFDGDGGTPTETSMKVKPGNTYASLPTASREGYTFGGWYTQKEGAGTKVENTTTVTETVDHTLFAKWEKQPFTVKFVDWNGDELKTETVAYLEAATPPTDPTREGYVFKGWDKTFDSVTSNLTVTATYAELYDIIYKDGETAFDSWKDLYTAPATYKEGDTVTLPANGNIEKAGYEFDGWYDNATFANNPVTGITATDKGDKTFYAKFTQIHTVKFVDWNDTTLKTQQVRNGEAATAPTDPTREGYVFKGWDIAFTSVASDLTVTAKYAEIFDITYKDGDAAFGSWKSSYTAPATYKEGDNVTLPVKGNIEKTGYEFDGWYTNKECTGTPATKIDTTDKGDKTFYAKFTQIHTVKFVDWNDTTLKTQQVRNGEAATAPSDPERTGYVFKGWDHKFDAVTSSLTIKAEYAKLSDITYKDGVENFASWAAEYTAPSNYEEGQGVTLPAKANIEKAGYAFGGWYDNAQCTGTQVTEIDAAATGDKTFYAKFVAAYTVTFKDHDGTTLKIEAVIDGNGATAPENPTREGYVFKGWDIAFTSVTSNLTVTAKYAEIFGITYKDGANAFSSWKADFNAPITYEENTGVTLPVADNINKDEYIFAGWFDNENLTGKPVTKIENTVNADVTLYAKWKQLMFEDNSGKIEFEEGQDDRWQFKIEQKQVDIANNIENIKAIYDIYFTFNNQRVEVKNQKMLITLQLEEKDQGFQNYKVVYMDNDGNEVEEYNPTLINDGKALQFEANHLSYYGILAWNHPTNPEPPVNPDKPEVPDVPDVPNKPDATNKPASSKVPKTGDSNNLAGLVSLLGLCAAGLVGIRKRKSRGYNSR